MQVYDFRRPIDGENDFINLIFKMLTINGKRVFEDSFEPSEVGKEYLEELGIMYFPTIKYFDERGVSYIINCFILKELK